MINNTRGNTNLFFCSLHKNVKLLLYEQVSDHRLTARNVSKKKIEIKLSFFFFWIWRIFWCLLRFYKFVMSLLSSFQINNSLGTKYCTYILVFFLKGGDPPPDTQKY